ncbi:alanine racemase [Micromonospora sp. NPDC049559]|uniref:alanine racemase n=1 Tax=Micromonospora sp. NPDC049559 TaxID=3155923 RepID=UPI0034156136
MFTRERAGMRPDEYVDWRSKGFWWPEGTVDGATLAAGGHHLFDGTFTWPVLTARGTAITRNIRTLAEFCRRHGLEFAPHGKTTMAPTLLDAQLRAGAWAITVATANQALVCRRLGIPRVLLANQLLDPTALRWLAGEAERGFELLLQVDSVAGARAAADALAAAGGTRPLRVLVELGFPGGRTGCRDTAALVEVARAVAAAERIELAGVTGYEGGLPGVDEVEGYLDGFVAATRELSAEGLLPAEVLVSAGGSAYFDVVARRLAGQWLPGHTLRTVLRSGAYVTHDEGFYREHTPFRRIPGEGSLDAALELWAQVLSTPEPGLAIAGLGKRDVSYDEGLPVPLRLRRADGTTVPAGGLRVTRLNDHHAYLAVPPDAPDAPGPGDLVCFGISHPCTAFDKWRAIPVLADDDTVSDVLHLYF